MHGPRRPFRALLVIALFSTAIGLAGPNPPSIAAEKSTPAVATDQRPIDINTADEQKLAGLPGIGQTIARRIVEFREKYGPFQRIEDLLKVKGIGEKSFQKLRAMISVEKTG